MTIFLNGHEPPFMQSNETVVLTADQIHHAVASMTYSGLQNAAVIGIHLMSKVLKMTPTHITNTLKCEEEIENVNA